MTKPGLLIISEIPETALCNTSLAALKASSKWTKRGGTIIVDIDNFTKKNLLKAGYLTDDPITEDNLQDFNIIEAPISNLTKESLKDLELDNKSVLRSKNMFALGIVFWLFDRPLEHSEKFFEKKFKKHQIVVEANKKVLRDGYYYAETIEALTPSYKVLPAEIEKGNYSAGNFIKNMKQMVDQLVYEVRSESNRANISSSTSAVKRKTKKIRSTNFRSRIGFTGSS